nr:ABC transporter substrate-binding protein [Sediminivirga luteola]
MVVSACGGGAADGDDVLYLPDGGGAWGEAQDQAFFQPFAEETGVEVVLVENDETTFMASTEAGDPPTDVVNVTGPMLANWTDGDLLDPIDHDHWEGRDLDEFDPYPMLEYVVPSLVYATQMAYVPEEIGGEMSSWEDFFDTETFPGQRTMGEGSTLANGVFEIALLADGVEPDELYPLDYDRALDKLSEIRPDILTFWSSGAESVQLLADRQVVAGAAWNGRVADVVEQDDAIEYSWDQALLYVDYWGVPAGAGNPEVAQQFIEFATRADRQAEFAEMITYAPTNITAYDLIDEERSLMLPTAPEHLDSVIPTDDGYWSEESPDGEIWSDVAIGLWNDWLAE